MGGEQRRGSSEARRPRAEYARLLDQVELVVAELRKRVGQTFTLARAREAYGDAERWARGVAEAGAPRGWPRTLAVVEAPRSTSTPAAPRTTRRDAGPMRSRAGAAAPVAGLARRPCSCSAGSSSSSSASAWGRRSRTTRAGRHADAGAHADAAAARAGARDGDGDRHAAVRAARAFRNRQLWVDSRRWPTAIRPAATRARGRVRLAHARPGGEVPRRRAEHDPQVVGPEEAACLLHAGRPPALSPLRPRRVPRALRARAARAAAGPLVLIVDDDAGLRGFVRASLELEGYTVREAASADEGLAALEEQPPDLILLDVMMPRVDGWEMLRRVQERHGVGAIPVLMFSGKIDEKSAGRDRARRAGLHRQAVRPAAADRVGEADARPA